MTVRALAFVGEHEGTSHLLLAEHDAAFQCLVERAVVALQSGLVERNGNAPEEREVQFLLGVTIRVGHQRAIHAAVFALTTPPLGVEGRLDERGIGGVQALAGNMPGLAEHAVLRVDRLGLQGPHTRETAPEFGKVAATTGGFHFAERRPHGLAGELPVGQRELARRHGGEAHGFNHERAGVARAERVLAIEGGVGTAVPEQAAVEPRVDHRGRVAAGHLTQRLPAAVEDIALAGFALVRSGTTRRLHQCAAE